MKLTSAVFRQSAEQRRINAHRALLRHLAKLGGNVFGTIPQNVRREFFCLDRNTWVWHEEWTDPSGQHHAVTTRYDVRPTNILKSQGSNSYQSLTDEEDRNFRMAVRLYHQGARAELQRLSQQTII